MTMAIVVNAYRAPVTRPEIRTLSMVYRFRIVAGVRAVPARTPAGLAVRGGRCRSGRRQVLHGLDLLADAFGGQRVDRRGRAAACDLSSYLTFIRPTCWPVNSDCMASMKFSRVSS